MLLYVEDVMTKDVVTVNSEYSVKYAAKMMGYFGISCLVVMENGKIEGILTERDILTRVVSKGLNPEKVSTKNVMSRPVIVVNPETTLEDALKTMLQRRIKKLPVVKGQKENTKLIGMLSITDVAKIQPKILESIRELTQMDVPEGELEVDFYIR